MKLEFNFGILFFLIVVSVCNAQPCLPNGIVFTSQQQIDDFPVDYPGCTDIMGDVVFEQTGNEGFYLDSLIYVNSIGGDLILNESFFPEALSGLNNLTNIGGSIFVNFTLVDLNGLDALTTIGGDLEFNYTYGSTLNLSALESVGGDLIFSTTNFSSVSLPSLEFVTGNFHLNNNNEWVSLNGLENLVSVGGDFIVEENVFTSLSGLQSLESIGDNFIVEKNEMLTTLEGLENLATIGGGVSIYLNPLLSDLSVLNNYDQINGSLVIYANGSLPNYEDLTNINVIHGDLFIKWNSSTSSLDGLESLEIIEGNLTLESLFLLQNIDPLSNLTLIEGELAIKNCDNLLNIYGIENVNLDSLQMLTLIGNNLLSFCQTENICIYLANGGNANIAANGSYCNTADLLLYACYSPCPPEDVLLNTQAQVEAFPGLYPDCEELLFDLVIESDVDNPITDLTPLDQITKIQNGNLIVQDNLQLESLNGLGNVNYVEEDVRIINNSGLVNLTGLESVTAINGRFKVESNETLLNFDGLIELQTISLDLIVKNNNGLTGFFDDSLGAIMCRTIEIKNNASLIDLNGLESLSFFTFSQRPKIIEDNENLASLNGLEFDTFINGDVHIENNPVLADLSALQNTSSIVGNFALIGNTSLPNLHDLKELENISGNLAIASNASLTTLDSLHNLQTLEESFLAIYDNNLLEDISGIANIDTNSITQLIIEANPNLSNCHVKSVCDFLEQGNTATILDNATGCNSQEEIEMACGITNVDSEEHLALLQIYPNPTSGLIFISREKPDQFLMKYKLYSSYGQIYSEGVLAKKELLDVSFLPNGVYFLQINGVDFNSNFPIVKVDY